MKLNLNLKKINFSSIKDFYDKNRQRVLTFFVVLCGVFFIFYWTDSLIEAKKKEYIASAKAGYEKLEKAAEYAVKIKQAEVSGARNKVKDISLLAFAQNTGASSGIGEKLVNIRPITTSDKLEHVSLRLENLYYDELVGFISRLEAYDNLRIKAMSFTRRYDNPSMIDISMEIVLLK